MQFKFQMYVIYKKKINIIKLALHTILFFFFNLYTYFIPNSFILGGFLCKIEFK